MYTHLLIQCACVACCSAAAAAAIVTAAAAAVCVGVCVAVLQLMRVRRTDASLTEWWKVDSAVNVQSVS